MQQGADQHSAHGPTSRTPQPCVGGSREVTLPKMPGGKCQKRPSGRHRHPKEPICESPQAQQVGANKTPRSRFGGLAQGVVVRDVVHSTMRQPHSDKKHSADPPSPWGICHQPRAQSCAQRDHDGPSPWRDEGERFGLHVWGQETKKKGRKHLVSDPSQVTISE